MFTTIHSYLSLPKRFYVKQQPVPVNQPELLLWNGSLSEELGITSNGYSIEELASFFSGNILPEGAVPFAQAYAGHQFGQFVPQLGDGRALMLGELYHLDGHWRDIQLKGSGRTPFSRGGDGRAPLSPALREYLISEAMYALGIPTTRCLAVVSTADQVHRQTVQPAAIVTRVASSHIRIGTFEYFAAREDSEALRLLMAYVINRHYPHLQSEANPALKLAYSVAEKQAELVARWVLAGFIHGVMNTDNMTVSGETIDYGPCAFMDMYDPATVFSSIDYYGRYAYGNQPYIGSWNMMSFAETLKPLMPEPFQEQGVSQDVAAYFQQRFEQHWLKGMGCKLGLEQQDKKTFLPLITELLTLMQIYQADYTLTFHFLADIYEGDVAEAYPVQIMGKDIRWQEWLKTWRTLPVSKTLMATVNPAVIPRNYQVEYALDKALEGNMQPYEQLLSQLQHPFTVADDIYMQPPPPEKKIYQTFCGT